MQLTQLGQKSSIPLTPYDAKIECIPWAGQLVYCRFTVPEFTSKCPITYQPDFARLIIDYVPDKLVIESKSLKLYCGSYRDHGAFHETVVEEIGNKLFEAAKPHCMRICAFFAARGGIPIDVFWQSGQVPEGVFIPDIELNSYKGR